MHTNYVFYKVKMAERQLFLMTFYRRCFILPHVTWTWV